MLLAAASVAASGAHADPINLLLVGNSFTHGRYDPALNYNAGPGNGADNSLVQDLLCPSLPCSGVEGVAAVTPMAANTPGTTTLAQLAYLQANPSAQYTKVGPFSGVARNLAVAAQDTLQAGGPVGGTSVPEPAPVLAFAAGLVGLAAWRRRA